MDSNSPNLLEKNVESFVALRRERDKPVSEQQARESMRNPLAASAMMVRRGDVDIGVGGNLSSTAEIIRTGLGILPKKAGIGTISSFLFMLSPDGEHRYIFADCAVVPEPSPDTLADIAIVSAEKARNLLQEEPRVALLSFSTKGSSNHPRAHLVSQAVEKIRSRAPDIMVDGELQFDAAAIPELGGAQSDRKHHRRECQCFYLPPSGGGEYCI